MKNRYYKLESNRVFCEYNPKEKKLTTVELYDFNTGIDIAESGVEYSLPDEDVRISNETEFNTAFEKCLELIKNKQLNSYD